MQNLDVQLMQTLWENTYRAMITTENNEYLATLRLIVTVPQDRENVPEDAPEVPAQLFVLVEDSVMKVEDIIDFETEISAKLRKTFQESIPHVYFFYPSPKEMLMKEAEPAPVN